MDISKSLSRYIGDLFFSEYQKFYSFNFQCHSYILITSMDSDQAHKKWKRKIQGNRKISTVTNPLRNFIQKQIKKIDLAQFPNRPAKMLDLAAGDPTRSEQFRTHISNLEILQKNVGKIDGYTNFQGWDKARETLVTHFPAPNYKISKDNVFLGAGGSVAMWASISLLSEEGDNFLFPSPGFPLSLVIAKSIGLEPRLYHLQSQKGWKANLEEMESLIDEKTKFVYVNDPSNPLGSCWPEEHKLEIIELCRKKNLPIIADEIYEQVTYEEPSRTFAELATSQVTVFKCSGLTKRWFGPGWRLGWLIVYGEEEKIAPYLKNLKNIFNVMLMPHTIMQASLEEIVQNEKNKEHLNTRLEIMRKNQHLIFDQLKEEKYCRVGDASGALYTTIVLKMQQFNKETIPDPIQFCKRLFAEENVLIFPGEFFTSSEPLVRVTISYSTDMVQDFVNRFKSFSNRHLKE